jgi:hypothetical protein
MWQHSLTHKTGHKPEEVVSVFNLQRSTADMLEDTDIIWRPLWKTSTKHGVSVSEAEEVLIPDRLFERWPKEKCAARTYIQRWDRLAMADTWLYSL